MTKKTINRGAAANDGSGDNLRAGAAKINENFDELYTALGDGTTLSPGNYITTNSTSIVTNKTIDGSNNTITNIPNSALSSIDNAKLTNSTITITGDGAQTSDIDLGDTLTIEGGTGITTSVTADKVSIAIDSAVLTEDSSDVLTNKTISGSTNTLNNIANTSLANSTVSYGGVQLNLGGVDATPAFDLTDATNYPTSSLSGTITNAQLDGSIANNKLANSKIVIQDQVAATQDIDLGSTFEIVGGGGLTTAASANKVTITASSIANSGLQNDSITIGDTEVDLGSTLSTTANLNLTGTSSLSGTGTIDLTGAGSKARFDFSGYGSLPTASTYVGMYAYDSVGNRPYYSSGSGWVRILDENSSVSTHTDVNVSGIADGYILKWSSAQGRFNVAAESGAGSFDLVNDTTPQLGGDLDLNGQDIVTTSNADISLLPNGSGVVKIDGNGSTSGISISDGLILMRSSTGNVAQIDMYCEVNNAHKVSLKPPAHANYSGNVTFTLPNSNGTNGYFLKTDGNGVTSWDVGGALTVQDEGSALATAATTLNFVGAGVTATGTGSTKTISISGGGGGGSTAINDLTDVTVSSPVAGDSLVYDGSGWVQAQTPVSQLLVTADGSNGYRFTGAGFPSTSSNNPTLYLKKGQTYYFINNSGGSHPFRIQSTTGTGGTAYNTGVTNNNASSGPIIFHVSMDTPGTLYYQCTNHGSMQGTITIS